MIVVSVTNLIKNLPSAVLDDKPLTSIGVPTASPWDAEVVITTSLVPLVVVTDWISEM